MPSAVPGARIRVKVIGAQTAAPESAKPYTVYRSVVTYDGECFERLLRYSEFYAFSKKLKLRNSSPMKAQFPSKTWNRKALLQDELIEARQVMLNEYMKEVCATELTASSDKYLRKLLQIGEYENGSGRVSEMSSYKASIVNKDGATMDSVCEADEEKDKVAADDSATTLALGGASTLRSMTCEFPVITSNATTVVADDERSASGSQHRIPSEEQMLAAQDAIVVDARASMTAATTARPLRPPTASSLASNGSVNAHAPPQKPTSIPPSPYSSLVLQKPAFKSSNSLPGRRSRHVEFPVKNGPVSAPVARTTSSEDPLANDGSLSPEHKYRELITAQLSNISRLLSDSDAETEELSSSSRSALASTA